MNRLLLTTLVLTGLVLMCPPATADDGQVVFADTFDGKLGQGWSWLRENPAAWRIREGGLEIRVEPGLAHNVKNALLRKAPDRREGTYAYEVTVTNLTPPVVQFEQVGITWYNNGRPVKKLVKERIDGDTWIIPGKKPMKAKSVQLRLIVTAGGYIAQFRPDGQGEFQTAGRGGLPAPGDDQVSLQCYHGPTDTEHWMRFDDFRIVKLED